MSASATAYRVLARKYRPSTFAELIGQEAMVRTLSNAIATGRIAHAFILTGVRGVGKTTTARILARALNCIGPDGSGPSVGEPQHLNAVGQVGDLFDLRHPWREICQARLLWAAVYQTSGDWHEGGSVRVLR